MDTILLILAVHWFADFVLQTDQMAQNKSKSNYWLSIHILVYMVPLLLFGWKFAFLNGACHFCVDYVTSRITSRLWQEKRVHEFFVVIGFDQMLHTMTLLATAHYIFHFF